MYMNPNELERLEKIYQTICSGCKGDLTNFKILYHPSNKQDIKDALAMHGYKLEEDGNITKRR